MWMRSGQTT